MRRAFCDSAAPRSSMSADERGMHKLSSAAGSVTCECFQTNYHHQLTGPSGPALTEEAPLGRGRPPWEGGFYYYNIISPVTDAGPHKSRPPTLLCPPRVVAIGHPRGSPSEAPNLAPCARMDRVSPEGDCITPQEGWWHAGRRQWEYHPEVGWPRRIRTR